MGHSQGGRAAWAYAERQAEQPVVGYRGTVALAPLSDAIAQVEQAAQDLTKPWALTALSLQPKLIDAVTAVYPSYQHAGFTKTVSKLWKLLKNVQGCLPTDSVIFSTITSLDQLARKGWTQDEEVQKWANLTRVGGKKFAGPLLALAGEADIAVPHELVTESVDQTCNFIDNEGLDASLEFVSYAALDHFPLIQGSRPTWLPWIRKQLCDTPPSVEKGCVRKTVEGFRNEYSPQSTTPNWLVDLAAATEVWKYTL
jgi:pimeloyl-ACP methyl ester carboxylesterase